MRNRSKVLRSLPLLAAVLLSGSSLFASPGGSRYNTSRYAGHPPRYASHSYRQARPRHSGYSVRRNHSRTWSPGHYVSRPHQVWVPGYSHQVWRPAHYETRYNHGGFAFQFQLSAGFYETVQAPGHYKASSQRVWVAGFWSN